MSKTIVIAFLLLLGLFLYSNETNHSLAGLDPKAPNGSTGTLEKMIVANGSVSMELDLNRLNKSNLRAKKPGASVLRFGVERDSFFTVLVFNDELRGPTPSTMNLIPQNSVLLPAKLNTSTVFLTIFVR